MRGFRIVPLLLGMWVSTAIADSGSVTMFIDGTLVEQRISANKGCISLTLPSSLIEGSLRVTPGPDTTIRRVDVKSVNHGDKLNHELDALTEQRQRLLDRLQALEAREEIFKSAAKSQSGKAPRKSKANPDPLQSIRQGTDFAIAQLEAVYTARRRTELEVRKIEARIAAARKSGGVGSSIVQVYLGQARGVATIRYATNQHGWSPEYRLRLDGNNSAALEMTAVPLMSYKDMSVNISTGSISSTAPTGRSIQAKTGATSIATYMLAINGLTINDGIRFGFSGRFTNSEAIDLPSGEMSIFKNNSYMGKTVFSGISSGRSRTITLGNTQK